MVRLILVLLFIILFLLVSLPILLVLWIVGLFRPDIKNRVSLAVVSWAFRVILFLSGTHVTRIGEENIPADEGVLFIGNHRSYFDIVITYGYAKRDTGFISKKQVGMVPVLSLWMRNLHCLFLDRNDLKQGLAVINQAAEYVKQGTNIVIYPEGTRNKTDQPLQEFHRGSFKIAQKSLCKIIPVTVTGTEEIYEKHRPFIRRADVTIIYGKPVDTAAMDVKERKTVDGPVREIIEQTYLEAIGKTS
ncbi:MAG: 1-acyl-sn-glycerol-3-phosphate acyltransferase [Lachnospiraceae bacterium]|nr:1-acyl-sn-glycerol-3-phosphate acyltransferase [Lachnospiraceae bacterium]